MLRPLTIVAGKGGVGRSTTAAALALNAGTSGRKVLAVDATSDGGLRAALATAPAAERANVELLELTTDEALDEYLKLYLKVPIPPSRLGPIARIFDYVAMAAPGVREILTIGKIANEVRKGTWDAVVVDAPATGHVIELLERLVETTQVDPIGFVVNRLPQLLDASGYDEAERLLDLLSTEDPLARAVGAVAHRSAAAVTELDRLSDLELGLTWVPESAEPLAAVRAALAEVES